MWIRIFKATLFACAVLCALCFAAAARAAALRDAADMFLGGPEIPEAVRDALTGKIFDAREAVCVEEFSGGVFSLAAGEAPSDPDADVERESRRAKLDANKLKARRNLMIIMAHDRVDRQRYSDDDALGNALDLRYSGKMGAGIQSASDIVDGWAFALVWTYGKNTVSLSAPDGEVLKDDYCSFLYERARVSLDEGRYADALPLFKHIHDLRWANIGMYLDASECFLRTGDADESKKLLSELISTLGGDMGSDDLTRAGRLFREAGDRASATSAFRAARDRYRRGK